MPGSPMPLPPPLPPVHHRQGKALHSQPDTQHIPQDEDEISNSMRRRKADVMKVCVSANLLCKMKTINDYKNQVLSMCGSLIVTVHVLHLIKNLIVDHIGNRLFITP